jgi:hypothetical protein
LAKRTQFAKTVADIIAADACRVASGKSSVITRLGAIRFGLVVGSGVALARETYGLGRPRVDADERPGRSAKGRGATSSVFDG